MWYVLERIEVVDPSITGVPIDEVHWHLPGIFDVKKKRRQKAEGRRRSRK